jgi:hypothetical protein
MTDLQQRIERTFIRLAQQRKPVKLLNTYKGYPVSHPAIILSAEKGQVKIQTHKHQVLCLNREHDTVMYGEMFPGYFKARVQRMEIANLQATLEDFRYIQEKLTLREIVRVTPRDHTPVWVTLKETGFRIKCELVDISQEGMGILLPIEYFVPNRIHLGAELLLAFELPELGSGKLATVYGRGIIRNTLGEAGQQHKRLGLRVYYDGPQRTLVFSYIQQRIQEIVREMERTFTALSRLSSTLKSD